MRVGTFSVYVPQGDERASGHVELPHGMVYTIAMTNHDYCRRCDAEVEVDGKSVGAFRLDKGCALTLERPSHDVGMFTFFQVDTQEANAAGVANVVKEERGLIRVTFRPERAPTARLQGVVGGAHAGGTSLTDYEH